MAGQSRYPDFDVLDEKNAWDDHTRAIVLSRLEPHGRLKFLTAGEAEIVTRICSLLVDDETPEVMRYVVGHIDQTLYRSPGESQRKVGVPAAPVLLRAGLQAVEQGAVKRFGRSFAELHSAWQKHMVRQISEGAAGPPAIWGSIPQKELFDKLRQLTVEAYCSHPKVWSAIGYAGPAYPRGYVRAQLGQTDPWEAKTK